MFTRQFNQHGSESYRDRSFNEREGYHIGNRLVEYAHEILSIEAFASRRDRGSGTSENTLGDILGPVFIQTKTPGNASPEGRPIGSWWHGCPVVITSASGGPGGVTALPIFDSTYGPDDRYEEIPIPTRDGEPLPEVGDLGIVYSATKEDGEAELVFIGSPPPEELMAVNRNPFYDAGSDVYDAAPDGTPDPSFVAKLQSYWRVVNPSGSLFSGPGSTSLLARQYGRAPDGSSSFGIGAVHRLSTEITSVAPGSVLYGCDGYYGGGPIFSGERMGGLPSYHKIGESSEGDDICASALHTLSIFHMPSRVRPDPLKNPSLLSGPFYFEPKPYHPISARPYAAQTHCVYDIVTPEASYTHEAYGAKIGKWRWWTEVSTTGDHPTAPDPRAATFEPETIVPHYPQTQFDPGVRRLISNRDSADPHEGYIQTPQTHGWTSTLLKARYTTRNRPDIHEYRTEWEEKYEEMDEWTGTSPIIVRKDAVSGHSKTEVEWTGYTQAHDLFGDNPAGRFLCGTKSGMELIYPPEIDILQIRDVKDSGGTRPTEYVGNKVSTFWQTFLPRERLAFGWPDLDSDTLYDGVSFFWDDSDSKFKFYSFTPGGYAGEIGFIQEDSVAYGLNHSISADTTFLFGKNGDSKIKGEKVFAFGEDGDSGDHQNSEYILLGELASGTASASLDIDGDAFAFPSGDSAYFFMAKTVIRSSSASALNADAVFVSRDEFAVNVTGGVASIIGAITNHFSRDEFTSGGAAISIAFSIASGNILRVSVSKTGTDDVEVTCYLTATQCRNS